jgi:hypothetical protein
MHRFRVGIPVWRAQSVIEAEAGAFSRWGLRVGDQIEIRTEDEAHPETRGAEPPVPTPGADGIAGA